MKIFDNFSKSRRDNRLAKRLKGYEAVGYLSCLLGVASLWTAFKVRTVS